MGDLIMCLKLPGIGIGRVCEKCDGKCPLCDTYVNPLKIVHICNECNYGSFGEKCILCGDIGVSDAYFCRECVLREKDVFTKFYQRDGCPRIINLGSAKADLHYEKKKF